MEGRVISEPHHGSTGTALAINNSRNARFARVLNNNRFPFSVFHPTSHCIPTNPSGERLYTIVAGNRIAPGGTRRFPFSQRAGRFRANPMILSSHFRRNLLRSYRRPTAVSDKRSLSLFHLRYNICHSSFTTTTQTFVSARLEPFMRPLLGLLSTIIF